MRFLSVISIYITVVICFMILSSSFAQGRQDDLLQTVRAQAPTKQIIVEAITPFTYAQAGKAVSMVVRFENRTSEEQSFSPDITLPDGWRLLIPFGNVVLGAGDNTVLPFSIMPLRSSVAGDYDIIVISDEDSSSLNRSEATFTINIPAVTNLDLKIVDIPEFSLADPYEFDITIQNTGNEELDIDLQVDDNRGYSLTPTNSLVSLMPRESQTIEVTVTPPVNLAKQTIQTVVVSALNRLTNDVIIEVQSEVKLIPTNIPESAAWFQFPVDVTLKAGSFSSRELDTLDEDYLEKLSFSVRGSGALSDTDQGRLEFDLDVDGGLSEPGISIAYEQPTYGVEVGNAYSYSLGGLISTTDTFGASAYYNYSVSPDLKVKPFIYSGFSEEGGIGLGLSSEYALDEMSSFIMDIAAWMPFDDRMRLALSSSYESIMLDQSWYVGGRFSTEATTDGSLLENNTLSLLATANIDEYFTSLNFSHSTDVSEGTNSSSNSLNFLVNRRNFQDLDLIAGYANYAWADGTDTNATLLLGTSVSEAFETLNTLFVVELLTNSVDSDADKAKFNVQAYNFFDPSFYTTQSLSFNYTYNKPENNSLNYVGSLAYLFNGYRLEPRLEVDVDVSDLSVSEFLLTLTGKTTQSFGDVNGSVTVAPFKDEYLSLSVGAAINTGSNNRFLVDVTTKFSENNDLDLSIDLGYVYRFDVPVSKRTNIGTVQGTLKDNKGNALSDIVVEVAGQSVQTNAQGEFEFPAVQEGQAFFRIADGQLEFSKVTQPSSPYFFQVETDGEYTLDFVILDTARVDIRVSFDKTETDQDSFSRPIDINAIVRDIEFIFTSEDGQTQERKFTNSSGEARFTGLTPGIWTVQVVSPLTEEGFIINLPVTKVEIAEGDTLNMDVSVSEKQRPIRFTDGGSVSVGAVEKGN